MDLLVNPSPELLEYVDRIQLDLSSGLDPRLLHDRTPAGREKDLGSLRNVASRARSVPEFDDLDPQLQLSYAAVASPQAFQAQIEQWKYPLTVPMPERAFLELLDEVPKHETFHQADILMEGLRNLSPRRLQTLLCACKSVKVKRLFFWFAERHNHAWLQKLDQSAIDLGQGKRMLVRGGRFDAKYNITVPENLDASV
jgi:hypothetical protein